MVSRAVNRLDNTVRGRRKRGGQLLDVFCNVIGYAVCDRGVRHPLYCGLQGRLLEVNRRLAWHTSGVPKG
ncbi:unnamed protein product [Protopolystoma xenopodis]|uniref:Uncharacterized protein n=1 Tax=Protopolystoma xenopodis TaxID=117903 RepID=A0A3S5CLD7_9PLAT|nr:unnamed protein product [Protopolystoma xenopodis]